MHPQIDFDALAKHIPTLCWVAGPDGFIIWYNSRWYEYTGSTPAEMEGWGWQSVHDPVELPRVLERWRASIATGAPFAMTFPLRNASGAFRPFLTHAAPSLDDNGSVTAWYGVNIDVSEQVAAQEAQHRAEATLRDLNARLEAQVEERTRALAQAKRESDEARSQAEAANLAKSEFLASMSHEIRTPLHGMLGSADLLRDAGPLNTEQSKHIARLQSAGAALLIVVNDILDFSKIEAGRIDLEQHPFPPLGLIDNVTSIVRSSAETKGLTLAVDIDPSLQGLLVGDQDRLRQVLLNLLNNAIKFTTVGSVTLRVRCEPSAPGYRALRFEVADTGIGIAQSKAHRLFERFSQIDGSIRRDFGGTGLGLAISKSLIELMGGQIGVESEEGRGSVFFVTVSLPIASDVAVPEPVAVETVAATAAKLRILVVDDVSLNQDIVRAVLERADHVVDAVSSGIEAIEAVQSNPYDMVLMDVQMPGMDGTVATEKIRALDHPARRLPIIAMTANVLPQQIAQTVAAGMDDHVGKPFKRDELYAVIGRWSNVGRETRPRPIGS